MNPLQIKLFGKFELKYTDLISVDFGTSKAQELFCYILLHRARSYPREVLAELLWGEDVGGQSRKFLRQTLWEVQSTLKAQAGIDDLRVLSVSSNWVQLNPNLSFELDVADFEHNLDFVQGVPIVELTGQHIDKLQKAEALYRGDLLEGWYWDWCAIERERFKDMYLTILDKLMVYFELHHQYEAGIAYGVRILNCDRALESAHQHLMRLYYLAGYRVKALRQFERCASILCEELDVDPSQQTRCLYEQIKADQLEEPTLVEAKPSISLLSDMPDRLKRSLKNLAGSESRASI